MGPHSGGMVTTGMVGVSAMDAMQGIAGLASDSRKVRKGYLFAALPGVNADGAAYIDDAVRRGAVAVLALPRFRRDAESRGVRFIPDENPRARLAHMAAAYFGRQPKIVAAVTGTNGKTSVCGFLRQIWERLGFAAASMGTIGLVAQGASRSLAHTTPDPIETHRLLAELAESGIDRLALEASSHGLDQHRLDGVDIAAVAFTNMSRDHLDYHGNFEGYLKAKLRLFREIARDDARAVVNADGACAESFLRAARERNLRLLTTGRNGDFLRLVDADAHAEGQRLRLVHEGMRHEVELPLAGGFQASNALVAAALAIGLGAQPEAVFGALAGLRGVPGRLEKVAYAASGAPIYVDYAHSPDALETVLTALRPHVANKLRLVFGCGGDRDRGKRPLMGAIAARLADDVVVTDDNPRSEDAASIRGAILSACSRASEIADRARAIADAISALGPGDALVIAGKGHETGQIVGAEVRPFSDRDEAIAAAVSSGGGAAEATA